MCPKRPTPDARPRRGLPPDHYPANFAERITNPYFPLVPGTTLIYEATKDGASEREELTVTKDTKVILGVRCVVVHHVVSRGGAIQEDTFDWYAQDVEGNVWYFGEASVEHKPGGTTSKKGSWEAGVDGAQPGIVMKAAPRVGETYRQEYYRGQAEDMAKVLSLSAVVTVPLASYRDVLLTEDFTPLEPDKLEHKYSLAGWASCTERWSRVDRTRSGWCGCLPADGCGRAAG